MSIHNQSRQAQTILSRIYENSNNNIVYEWLNTTNLLATNYMNGQTHRDRMSYCYLHGASKYYPDFRGS